MKTTKSVCIILFSIILVSCFGSPSNESASPGSSIGISSKGGSSLSMTAGSSATISLDLVSAAGTDTNISWTINGSGSDFPVTTGSLQILAGAVNGSFDISTSAAATYLGSRSYTVDITTTGAIATTLSINVTVNDNIAPNPGGSGVIGSVSFTWVGGATNQTSGFYTNKTMSNNGYNGGLQSPLGSAVDSKNGYLYVADNIGSINKYSLLTGALVGAIGNVVSSLGTCPSSGVATGWCTGGVFSTGTGDGAFMATSYIAVDSTNGFLYVADSAIWRISKFNLASGAFIGSIGFLSSTAGTCPASGKATGWCTGGTFTGGTSDGAFSSIAGMAVDPTGGFLYVSDNVNYQISKFNLASGAFVGAIGSLSATSGTCPASGPATGWCTGGTFASGTADGEFSNPSGLTADATNGFLYVLDGASRINKINSSTGAFVGAVGEVASSTGTCPNGGTSTTWCTGGTFTAGTGDAGFSGLVSIAVNASGGYLYVIDGSSRITRLNLNNGTFNGSVGSLSASSGACPASGAASGWCGGGTFATGSGDGMFQTPNHIALDTTHGYFYVVDSDLHRVAKHDLSSGAFSAALGLPERKTTKWSSTTELMRSSSGTGEGMFGSAAGVHISGIAVDPSRGFFYVADTNNSRVMKFNLNTGAFVGAIGYLDSTSGTCPASGAAPGWCNGGTFIFNPVDGGFGRPTSLAIDVPHGFLFIADTRRIVRVNVITGAFDGAIGRTSASSGTCPASGAASGWCTGGTFIAGSDDGMFQTGPLLAVDGLNERLYVADVGNYRIQKINSSTGAFIGAVGKLSATSGDCPASGVSTIWCTGGTFTHGIAEDGAFYSLSGIAVDGTDGKLYVADNTKVSKFALNVGAYIGSIGSLTNSSGTCPASGPSAGWCTGGTFGGGSSDGAFNLNMSLALNYPDDLLYVTDVNSGKINKFTLSTGVFIGAVGKVSASSGTCTAGGAASAWCTGGTFESSFGDGMFGYHNTAPLSIATDAANNIYVCDPGNSRVVKGPK